MTAVGPVLGKLAVRAAEVAVVALVDWWVREVLEEQRGETR